MDLASRRTAQPYLEALAARSVPAAVRPGASSYFTAPTKTLDPHLFDGREQMRGTVRSWLRETIHGELTRLGYRNSIGWLRIWLAGSGASYQWSAARDPGDLDILLGVDYVAFREANLQSTGLSDREIGDRINESLSNGLWKRTARQQLGGGEYEVTWYINPKSTDIRNIHPYAAYDVDRGDWTVRPIDLPAAGPGEWFPATWDEAAQRDADLARVIVQAYNEALEAGRSGDPARQLNARTMLAAATRQAEALFDEIHQGRHAAFDEQGQGYRDFANYRWQRGKELGTIPALRAIHDQAKDAREATDLALYGAKLQSTEHVRIEAAMGGRRG